MPREGNPPGETRSDHRRTPDDMLSPLDLIAILLTFAAGFAFINHCWLRLPATIGLFLLGFLFASAVTGLDAVISAPDMGGWLRRVTEQADLPDVLLTGVLG